MAETDRLKEIEVRLERMERIDSADTYMMIADRAHEMLAGDVPWLIARVRELEAALLTQQSKSCDVCGKKVWLHQAGVCQCGNEVYG